MDCNGCSQWSVLGSAFENIACLEGAGLRVGSIGKLSQSNWNPHRTAVEGCVCRRSKRRPQSLRKVDCGLSRTGMSKLRNRLPGGDHLSRLGQSLDNDAVRIRNKL